MPGKGLSASGLGTDWTGSLTGVVAPVAVAPCWTASSVGDALPGASPSDQVGEGELHDLGTVADAVVLALDPGGTPVDRDGLLGVAGDESGGEALSGHEHGFEGVGSRAQGGD